MKKYWFVVLPLIFIISACNNKVQQLGQQPTDPDLTPKSGEEMSAPNLVVYDDLKQVDEGTFLSEKELANKICYCGYEITRMNDDVQRYHRNNDRNSILRTESKIDAAFTKFDRCMAEIKAQYPKAVAENDPKDVFAEVGKQCPVLIEIMEAGKMNMDSQKEE